MARKERTLKNSLTAGIKYFVKLVLQFVIRTLIIYKLGVEYVGLDSLYANIISMLSLAELGIGTAISYSMYKPAAENDIEKLKSLNALYKKIYTVIALAVLAVGLSLLPFLEFFINGTPNVDVNLELVYLIFLISTAISYLGAHKRSLLFATQRNDVENNVFTTKLILLSTFQALVLLISKNYYVYVSLNPLFNLLEVILVISMANKMYPQIRGKAKPLDKLTKNAITKNIFATSLHQIGSVVVLSTDNLLISKFFGLEILGTVSNYILIYHAISSFILMFIQALQASVGNLVATKSEKEVYNFYKMFNFIFSCMVGFCSVCLMCLYQPFMHLWVGKTEYVVSIVVVISLVGKFYFTEMREVTNMFKNCTGLMWNDRFKPIFEAAVNIVASLLCIKYFGLAGVFIGTIISTVLVPFWVEPLVLHKNYFKQGLSSYFLKYLYFTFVSLLACGLSYYICCLLPAFGILWLILKLTVCIFNCGIIFLIFYFRTKEFKIILNNYLKPILKKIKKQNNGVKDE